MQLWAVQRVASFTCVKGGRGHPRSASPLWDSTARLLRAAPTRGLEPEG
jgi:hypothetical protein